MTSAFGTMRSSGAVVDVVEDEPESDDEEQPANATRPRLRMPTEAARIGRARRRTEVLEVGEDVREALLLRLCGTPAPVQAGARPRSAQAKRPEPSQSCLSRTPGSAKKNPPPTGWMYSSSGSPIEPVLHGDEPRVEVPLEADEQQALLELAVLREAVREVVAPPQDPGGLAPRACAGSRGGCARRAGSRRPWDPPCSPGCRSRASRPSGAPDALCRPMMSSWVASAVRSQNSTLVRIVRTTM